MAKARGPSTDRRAPRGSARRQNARRERAIDARRPELASLPPRPLVLRILGARHSRAPHNPHSREGENPSLSGASEPTSPSSLRETFA